MAETPKPFTHCGDCGQLRWQCVCEERCELNLSDEVTKKLQDWIASKLEEGCREVQTMGWGYRLATQVERRRLYGRVVYELRTTILIPGQQPPPGEWTIYSPWLEKDS